MIIPPFARLTLDEQIFETGVSKESLHSWLALKVDDKDSEEMENILLETFIAGPEGVHHQNAPKSTIFVWLRAIDTHAELKFTEDLSPLPVFEIFNECPLQECDYFS